MAEISSSELRTLLRGGEDIYQVKKVLGQSNIQGPNFRTAPGWLGLKVLRKHSAKTRRVQTKQKSIVGGLKEIREYRSAGWLPVAWPSWYD